MYISYKDPESVGIHVHNVYLQKSKQSRYENEQSYQ